MRIHVLLLCCVLFQGFGSTMTSHVVAAEARVQIKPLPPTNGWFGLSIQNPTNRVYNIQTSEDLRTWTTSASLLVSDEEAASGRFPSLHYYDPGAARTNQRFYRVVAN